MTNSYDWYQDVYLNIFNWYQDFICFLTIGINAFIYFQLVSILKMFLYSFQLISFMHFIDIFLLLVSCFMSPLYWLFVLNKKGENILLLLLPLCWCLTKRGRSIWVYMHVLFVFISLSFNWYQKHFIAIKSMFLLVSRARFMHDAFHMFGIKSMFLCLLVYLFMHELRGSFSEA